MRLLWFLTCVTLAAWMSALGVGGPVYGLGTSVDLRIVVLLIGALPGFINTVGNPNRRRRHSAPVKKRRQPKEPDLEQMIRHQPWYRALQAMNDTPQAPKHNGRKTHQ